MDASKSLSKAKIKLNNNNRIITNNFINSRKEYNSGNSGMILKTNENNKEKIKKIKNIMLYNNEEKNNLSHELAIKEDKRTYCQYYISLLKTKQLLIFTFCENKDYNSRIIKIDLFFISFLIYYTVNALFFSDNTMHKIYEDEGSFNFIYQLPQIIYSSLISTLLNYLLKLLALSEGNIVAYKENKKKINLEKRTKELKNKLNIKFIFYFIINFLFLSCFWYYLFMFCAVYKNTQLYLLKDTLISFSLSLIYPFFLYLLPGLFRIPSLKGKDKKCLYGLSKVFQLI